MMLKRFDAGGDTGGDTGERPESRLHFVCYRGECAVVIELGRSSLMLCAEI